MKGFDNQNQRGQEKKICDNPWLAMGVPFRKGKGIDGS